METYINVNAVKDQIKVLYRELSLLRDNIEVIEEKKVDLNAFENLAKLGETLQGKAKRHSTKVIIDDIRS